MNELVNGCSMKTAPSHQTPDSMFSTSHLDFKPVNEENNFEESNRNEKFPLSAEHSDSDTDYENPIEEENNNQLKCCNSSSFNSSGKESISINVLQNYVCKLWNKRNYSYFDSSPKNLVGMSWNNSIDGWELYDTDLESSVDTSEDSEITTD